LHICQATVVNHYGIHVPEVYGGQIARQNLLRFHLVGTSPIVVAVGRSVIERPSKRAFE
jgi:hypothetical protein